MFSNKAFYTYKRERKEGSTGSKLKRGDLGRERKEKKWVREGSG